MSDFPENENMNQENLQEENVPAPQEENSTVFSDPTEHKKATVRQKKKLLPVIISALLAVAVLAGGTVAVIKLIPERDEDFSVPTIETITVLKEDSADFKSVTVTNANGTFKLYSAEETVKTDSSDSSGTETEINWYLDGYDKELIDSSSVSNVADYAASLEAVREITAKTAAECGLESPVIRADVVKNDDSQYSILVGSESPDGTGIYVKLSTDDKIYVAESTIKDNFTFDALSFAETSQIPGITVTDDMGDYKDDEGALSSFDTITLTGKNYPETVVLAPNNDKIFIDYATYMTLAPTKRIADNVSGVFNFFKNGAAVSGAYSFDNSVSARKQLGLDNPDLVATIKIGSFSSSYSFKQQDDGNYAVWYDGAKLIKKITAANISFINNKTTDYYASWVCLQSINELSNFTLKTPEKDYSFDIVYDDSDDAEETYVITYEGEKLVAENFQNFYEECIRLSCVDYTIANVSGEPEMSIVFTYSDTSRESVTVDFIKSSETKYQYRINGMDMGKVNSTDLNKILRLVKKVANGESIN